MEYQLKHYGNYKDINSIVSMAREMGGEGVPYDIKLHSLGAYSHV